MTEARSGESDNPEILLEVRSASSSGDLGPRVVALEEFRARASEIADSIAEVAEDFRARLGRSLDKREDPAWQVGSIEIAFSIAVQAEAGVVISKATAGATFSAKILLQAHQDQQR